MSDTAVHGMNSVVLMDDTSLRELGTSVRTPLSRQDVDVSVFGMVDMEGISGMRNGALNFEGIRKGDLPAYLRMCRSAIGTENTNHLLTYGPDGSEVGMQAFLINSNQNSFEVNSPYAGAVMISAVFAATGGPRYGVFLSSAHGSTLVSSPSVQRITLTNVTLGEITVSADGTVEEALFNPATASNAAIASGIAALFPAWAGKVTAIKNIVTTGTNNGTIDVYFDSTLGAEVADLSSTDTGVVVSQYKSGGFSRYLNVRSATGNGASHDNGAATTNGYRLNLHNVYAANFGGSLTVRFQDSADNVTFATVASFNVLTGTGSQQIQHKTATVRRYTRVRWEITGTSPGFAFAVSMSRHGNVKWAG